MTIGSANFDEAAVVAEIYAQALEAAGFTVERNLYTGPRETTLPAHSRMATSTSCPSTSATC